MASRREQEIRKQKRQDFQDRRQYNRIVQMLNQQKAEQTAATTTPTTATDPSLTADGLTGANDPAARAGLEGNFIPSKAGQELPQWYQGTASRTPAARKGLTGTPSWWNSALAGAFGSAFGIGGQQPGVAQGMVTVAGGRALPQWLQGRTPTRFGSVFNRNVSADTGMPDFPMLTQTGPQLNFGSGSWWNSRRRRGGGGRPQQPRPQQPYQPDYQDFSDDGPAWGRGLANWSIG